MKRPDLVFAVLGDVRLEGPANERALDDVLPVLRNLGAEAVVVCSCGGAVRLVRLDGGRALSAAVREAFASGAGRVETVRLNGYDFVMCNAKQFAPGDAPALRGAAGGDPGRPFFCFQRRHPRGTCAGDFVAEQDEGALTAALNGRKNALVFSVGARAPLGDERSIRQGAFGFTAVQTSSFHAPCPFGGRENALPYGRTVADYRDDRQMPNLADCSEKQRSAVVVSAAGNACVVSRRSLASGARLGPDWTVDPAAYGAYDYERRAKTAPVPAFGAQDSLKFRTVKGRTMKGAEAEQVVVTFPKAGVTRAHDYVVTVHYAVDGIDVVVAERRVYSAGFLGPEEREPERVSCVFAKAELFQDVFLRFEVRATNAFGVRSEPIVGRYRVAAGIKWRG